MLDALGRGLLNEFPNPNRVGCPDTEVLRKIASREMALSDAATWLDHLGSCSPCYDDFRKLRTSFQQSRRQIILAVAAGILVVASAAAWWFIRSNDDIRVAQSTVVDLRTRSVARGPEAVPNEPPLEIRRNVSRLDILLPLGSSEGPYEVRLATTTGTAIVSTLGVAYLRDGVTSIKVVVNLSSIPLGRYFLQVRKPESNWNSYVVMLR